MKHNNTVAVENDLDNVRKVLQAQGYQAVGMDQQDRANCIVVSGMDQNFLGRENMDKNIPVITAKGRTAEEVLNEIKRFMS